MFSCITAPKSGSCVKSKLLMFAGNISGALFIAGAGLFGGNYRLMMIVLTAISLACMIPMLLARESKLKA